MIADQQKRHRPDLRLAFDPEALEDKVERAFDRAPGRHDAPSSIARRLIDDHSTPDQAAIAVAARYLGLSERRATS